MPDEPIFHLSHCKRCAGLQREQDGRMLGKLRIVRFRASAKAQSLRCFSFSVSKR